MGFFIAILSVLAIVWLILFVKQGIASNKAVVGKVISVLISIILVAGIYYVHQGNDALRAFAGGGVTTMVENVVVAVRTDDPAETLQDAAHYNFGVQYATGADSTVDAIAAINNALGAAITKTEYPSLFEQVHGLLSGEVQAIIYNEAFGNILEEIHPGFLDEIRVIALEQIVTEVEGMAADIEVTDETFAIFISGIDAFGVIENGLSDVNMLMLVNPTTHQILLVNTPRDYYIPFPGITGGRRDKLTHAGIYGVHTSMAALEELYGIDIPFYVRVNFTAFINVIDALGGIDVYSAHAFTTRYGRVPVSRGWNQFNGHQALEFSRERFSLPDGDLDRGANAQAVITAILRRAMSPAILTGATTILNSIASDMDTNMTIEQIQELIRTQLSDGPSWNIKSMAADGTFSSSTTTFSMPGPSLFVIIPDQASVDLVREQIAALQRGEILVDSEVLQ